MPDAKQEIELLDGSKIKVHFIWRFDATGGPPYYPQAIRAWSAEKAEALRGPYQKMEWLYAGQLASMVQNNPAYIFAPQSRHPFARAYLEACKSKHTGAIDISERFEKVKADIVAGEEDTTAEDVYRSLRYKVAGDEASIESILMVDDVVAGQKTTTAMFTHLVQAGMPTDACITVASLLRVNATKQSATK